MKIVCGRNAEVPPLVWMSEALGARNICDDILRDIRGKGCLLTRSWALNGATKARGR